MSRLVPDETWAVLTIWQEARGERQPGRVAVAEVIRNRMRRHYISDGTVAGTVLRPLQFSGWNTKDPNRLACAMLDAEDALVVACRAAWAEALGGSNRTLGAVLYYSPSAMVGRTAPPWVSGCRQTAAIGRHVFFVPRGWA